MLKTVTLKFTDSPDLVLDAKGVTIFVGPNNSGKSLVLREIEEMFETYDPQPQLLVKSIELDWNVDLNSLISLISFPTDSAGAIGLRKIGHGGARIERVPIDALKKQWKNKETRWVVAYFAKHYLIRLDGKRRFQLTDQQSAGDLGSPDNTITRLFSDDTLRKRARDFVFEAFKAYLVIDPTRPLGKLSFSISATEPGHEERSLDAKAVDFYKAATPMKDSSDGVQCYVGIITAVLSPENRVILIDEPEAFLHPPLARMLGRHLSSVAKESGGALLASTHSADFVIGCIQGGAPVQIVRMDFKTRRSKGVFVSPDVLKRLYQHPLLRNANVISGLFHDGVIVVESSNDQAFYGEILHRISRSENSKSSILVVHAQNKQTMKDIVLPLRQFGIPVAAIADIDIVKEGGQVWAKWIEAIGIPKSARSTYSHQRKAVYDTLQATGKNMKSDGGIAILSQDERESAEEFFESLQRYGLFVVQRGELENWLPNVGATGKKTDWAVDTLEKLGTDPNDAKYVHPSTDDVWQFVRNVVAWIEDPGSMGLTA